MKRPVNTKADFVARYIQGEFGNHAPSWDTLEEWIGGGYSGWTHIRNRIAGGPTFYDLAWHEVKARWNYLTNHQGVLAKQLYLSAMAPTKDTVLQGEVCELAGQGLHLRYTTVRAPMRDALAQEERIVHSLKANIFLQYYLCTNSWEWLKQLLRDYPSHVIEFSTYNRNWGTVSGYNTVFWEVRNY